MTNIFKKLTTNGLEETNDRLGGAVVALETGVYTGKIKAAYAGVSAGGATSVTSILDIAGREYNETLYVTNVEGQNYFLNKNDKSKKVPLPGFTTIDDICLITTSNPLSDQDTEEKTISIYDFDAKKDMPKVVPMLTELLGKEISLGIVKQTVDKKKDSGTKDEHGKKIYALTGESRDENVIDKVFHPELRLTVTEARNGQDVAKFWDAWEEKNKGVTRDKRSKETAGAVPGAPPKPVGSAPSAAAPRKSLFGNKG